MRNLIAILSLVLFFQPSIAQEKALIVEGATPNLYISHIISPKENYYSVGRMYNVSPKEVAAYNNLPFEKGLQLGVTIKIPLIASNFNQGGQFSKDEALIPLYHIVQPKEGLYRISMTYNKVPLENLKKWNNLQSDVVSNGTRLIIGYLKVLKEQSSLALKGVPVTNSEVVTTIKEEKQPVFKPDLPKERLPVIHNPETSKETAIETKEKPKVIETKRPETNKEDNPVTTGKPSIDFAGGYFKKLYNNQVESKAPTKENGTAGIFKTTSGWMDGKYYCFHNDAAPGTILKVTNNSTGRSVYAKVLDAVPDIKQNNGLLLRISNSAAEELGVADTKFDCSIIYTKL